MTKSEFIEWLQTAKFKIEADIGGETDTESYDYTDDDGQEHFKPDYLAFVWNTAEATLPDGSPFEVTYQEALNWSGTMRERYEDDYDAEPADEDLVWNTRRPTVTDDDDLDEELDKWDVDELVKEYLPGLTDIAYERLIPTVKTEEIDTDTETDMEEIIIERDNAPNLKFKGEGVAAASSKNTYNDGGRWTILKLFRTAGGKFVCQTIGVTCWQGERDRYSGAVCETEAEVIAYFGHGWLAKELYEEACIEDVESVD